MDDKIKFRQDLYLDLKDAYPDFTQSEEEFNKQIDTNPNFLPSVYRDMKKAYGDNYKLSIDEFAGLAFTGQKLKKKDGGIVSPTELGLFIQENISKQSAKPTPQSPSTKADSQTKYKEVAPVKDTTIDTERGIIAPALTPEEEEMRSPSAEKRRAEAEANREKERLKNIENYHTKNIVEAEQRGYQNTDQLFEDRKTFIAQNFLESDVDKEEFTLYENLLQSKRNYERLQGTKSPGEKIAEEEFAKAQVAYNDFLANRDAKIDQEIAKFIGLKEAQSVAGAAFGGVELFDFDSRINTLQNKKGRFFKEKQEAQAVKENEQEISRLNIGGKTPQEKIKRYYNALYAEYQDLQTQYPNITKPTGVAGSMQGNFVLTDDTPDEARQRYAEVEQKLRNLAPIVLINRNPLEQDTPLSTFGKAAVRSFDATVQGKQQTEQTQLASINQMLSDIETTTGSLEQGAEQSLVESEKRYEDYTANDWASMLGVTAGAMLPVTLGDVVLTATGAKALKVAKAYSKGTKLGQAIEKSEDAFQAFANTKTGKILKPFAEGVKTGTSYELGQEFFGTPDSEMTFISGFFGGAAGAASEKLLSMGGKMLVNVFGTQAPQAARLISQYGKQIEAAKTAGRVTGQAFGEVAEEFGEMFAGFYEDTESFAQAWELFTKEFGEGGEAEKTFVSSLIMGLGFGSATELGRFYTQSAKEMIDNAPPDKKAKYQGYIALLNKDIEKTEKELGITEEPEAQKTEQPQEAQTQEEFAIGEEVEFLNPATNQLEKGVLSAIDKENGTFSIEKPDGSLVEEIVGVNKVAPPVEEKTQTEAVETTETTTEEAVTETPAPETPPTTEEAAKEEEPPSKEEEAKAEPIQEVVETKTEEPVKEEPKKEEVEKTEPVEPDNVSLINEGNKTETIESKGVEPTEKTTLPKNEEVEQAEPSVIKPQAQTAREKGEFTQDTITYKRQEPIAENDTRVVLGKEGTSTFKPGQPKSRAKYRFALTTLDAVQPTQKGTQVNPLNFIPESQPKPISEERVQDNKRRATTEFENEAIGVSGTDPFRGFVNTNQRLEVFQGTGRWNILNENPNQQARIDYLKSVAEQTGISPEQIDEFVKNNPGKKIDIVRVYDVNDNQAIRLGQFSSTESESTPQGTEENQIAARMNNAVQKQVYSTISTQLKANPQATSDKIIASSGTEILNTLAKGGVFSNTELSRYKDTDGNINEAGRDLLKSVYANIVANPDSQNNILSQLPANTQEAVKNSALFIAGTSSENTIVPDFQAAVRGYYKYINETKDTGTSVEQWLKQKDTLTNRVNEDLYTPLQKALIKNLSESKSKPTVLPSVMREYNQLLNGKSDIFEQIDPMTREQAVERIWGVDYTTELAQDKQSLGTAQEIEKAATELDDMLSDIDNLFEEKTQNTQPNEDTQTPSELLKPENAQEIDLAFGTLQQAQEAIIDFARTVKNQVAQKADLFYRSFHPLPKIAESFAQKLEDTGSITFEGQEITSQVQLAELAAMVLRNPRVENGMVVFMSKGKIQKVVATSLGLMGQTSLNPIAIINNITPDTDQIYFIHNHPSGNPEPSTSDKYTIRLLSKAVGLSSKGVEVNGLVLNGNSYADIKSGEIKPYAGGGDLYTPGTNIDSIDKLAAASKSIIEEGGTNGAVIFVDQRKRIVAVIAIPKNTSKKDLIELIKENKTLLSQDYIITGQTDVLGELFKTRTTLPSGLEAMVLMGSAGPEIILPNEFRKSGIPITIQKAIGAPTFLDVKESTVEITPSENPKFTQFANQFVEQAYKGGRFAISEVVRALYQKNDTRLEALVPYVIQAYKDYKAQVSNSPNYTAEYKNQFSSDAEINSLDTNQIKKQVDEQRQRQQIEQDAESRRQASITELGLTSRPIYQGGVKQGGNSIGRPPLRYSHAGANSPFANIEPPVAPIVVPEQYPVLDQNQIYGVNMALTRFKTGNPNFLLADGTGVGKTMQQLVIAAEQAKTSKKPVIVITASEQIINDNFKADAQKLGVSRMISTRPTNGEITFYTYTDLSLGKVPDTNYGLVVFDEAHNLKNITSKKSQAADTLNADAALYATATPMDKPINSHYFLSKISGYSPEQIQQLLGYSIVARPNDRGELETSVQYSEGVTIADVAKNIIALRNELIAKGGMIRRNYPFYGSVEEVSGLPVDDAFLSKQEKIEEFFNKKLNAISRYEKDPIKKAQKMLTIGGDKSGELSRLTEPYKVNFAVQEAIREVQAGRKVVIVINGVNDTKLKGLDNEVVPSTYNAIAKKLTQAGIKHEAILGSDKAAKSRAAKNFQDGNTQVIIMTPQSGGVGINLDDTKGDAPRTLIYLTPDYGADMIQQVLGRVSRRNTQSPARAIMVYTNSVSDQKRKKIVENKMAILQAIQDGKDVSEIENEFETDTEPQSLFDQSVSNQSTNLAKSTTEPYMTAQPNGDVFVYNSYHIKDYLKQMGARFRRDTKGNGVWVLGQTQAPKVAEFLDAYYRASDSSKSMQERIADAWTEFQAAVKEDSKYLGANRFPFATFKAAAKLAYLNILKGVVDFKRAMGRILQGVPYKLRNIVEQAWDSVIKSANRVKKIGSIEALTPPQRNQLAASINTAYNRAVDYTSLMSELTSLHATLLRVPRLQPLADALTEYMTELNSVNTLDAAQTMRYQYIMTKEEMLVSKFIDNVWAAPQGSKRAELWQKAKQSYLTLSANLDSPYIAVNRLLVDKIQKEYGIPKEFAVPMHRRFEQIAGYAGVAKAQVDKINELLNTITLPSGVKSKKLNAAEIREMENMIFALRTIDRLKQDRATGNLSIGLMNRVLERAKIVLGPERYSEIEERIEMYQKLMDDNLKSLLDNGIISQESYDAIKDKNKFYAPFAVVQEQFDQNFIQQANAKNTPYSPIKSIQGIRTTLNYNFGGNYDQWLADYRSGMLSIDQLYQNVLRQMDRDYNSGLIDDGQYMEMLRVITDPGFEIMSVLEKSKQILFNSTLLMAKNNYMKDLGRVISQDAGSLFSRMVPVSSYADIQSLPKPKGFDLVFWREAGQFKAAYVNQSVADAINGVNKVQMGVLFDVANMINNVFRTAVIGLSPSFVFTNFLIYDMMRTLFFSRAGIFAGFDTSIKTGVTNMAMLVPDLIMTVFESLVANTIGRRPQFNNLVSDGFKQYMQSPAYSESYWKDLFNTEQKTVVKTVNDFIKSTMSVPMNTTEQAMNYFGYKRLMRGLEALKNQNATNQEITDYLERAYYEIRNNVGSPDFKNTSSKIKALDIIFPFFTARVKGMMTDARRVKTLFAAPITGAASIAGLDLNKWFNRAGEGEGTITPTSQAVLGMQLAAFMSGLIIAAMANHEDDEAIEDFMNLPPQKQISSVSYKTGNSFVHTMTDGTEITLPEYLHIPLRGVPEVLNAIAIGLAQEVAKNDKATWREIINGLTKEQVLDKIKDVSMPINTNGGDVRGDRILSVISSTNPLIKYSVERAFNVNTYTKKPIYPSFMANQIKDREALLKMARTNPDLLKEKGIDLEDLKELPKPYEFYTPNTPQWAIDMSRKIYESSGIEIYPNDIDHIENTFLGNTWDRNFNTNPVTRALFRSGGSYPINYRFEQDLMEFYKDKKAEQEVN